MAHKQLPADSTAHPGVLMCDHLTRRAVVVAGAALLIAGCARKPQRSVYSDPASRTDDVATEYAVERPPVVTPGDIGIWYAVKTGDTLHGIARRSGLTSADIRAANRLSDIEIKSGQKLWLPGIDSIAPPVARGEVVEEIEDTPASGTYEFIPRSKWTRVKVGKNNNPMNGVLRITVHHTGEHAGMEGLPETDVIRRIESYHRNGRRWAAIGYHYLVGKNGHVYEGRPIQYQGAHVSGANEHNVGISVIGDFMGKAPTGKQLTALRAFLDDQRVRFKVSRAKVYGHRDLGASECPGNALYAWLGRYKAGKA